MKAILQRDLVKRTCFMNYLGGANKPISVLKNRIAFQNLQKQAGC